MIDEKELRIGNWIEDDDNSHERFKVEKIDIGEDQYVKGMYFVNGRWVEDLLPIPLTPEILKGIKDVRPTIIDGFECFFNGDNVILVPEINGVVFYLHSEANGHKWILRNLNYLHELQNTYFFVTGYELEVVFP